MSGKRTGGDCFGASIDFMLRKSLSAARAYTLVHGIVTRPDDGLHHVHAWIEVGEGWKAICINVANGRTMVTDRATYYRIGQVGKTCRYTIDEIHRLCLETEHCGPWDEELDRLQERVLRDQEEENNVI